MYVLGRSEVIALVGVTIVAVCVQSGVESSHRRLAARHILLHGIQALALRVVGQQVLRSLD